MLYTKMVGELTRGRLKGKVFPIVAPQRSILPSSLFCVYVPIGGEMTDALEGNTIAPRVQIDLYERSFESLQRGTKEVREVLRHSGLMDGWPEAVFTSYETEIERFRSTFEIVLKPGADE